MRLELSRAAGSAPAPSRATSHYDDETDARFRVWDNMFRARTRPRICATRRRVPSLESLARFARASGAEHTRLGRLPAAAFSPGVLAIGGQPSPGSQKQRRCISFTASFSSKCVQQDEHGPNATRSTTIQALNLCDRSFATYGRRAWSFLELLGAG
jgi:hypothetical protein